MPDGRSRIATLILGALIALSIAPTNAYAAWTGAWQTSPVRVPARTVARLLPAEVEGTLRFRIHLTLPGRKIRLRFSNEFGTAPLVVGGASVGRAAEGSAVQSGTLVRVTFDGHISTTIPRGAHMLSDPVNLPIGQGSDLIVSIGLPQGAKLSGGTGVPAFLVAGIDAVDREAVPAAKPIDARSILSGVEVDTDTGKAPRVIMVLGDSIKDSHVSISAEARGWTDLLGRKLVDGRRAIAVVNAGIGGNRVLTSDDGSWEDGKPAAGFGLGDSMLARFDRDVLAVPGVSHLVIFAGINDIGRSNNAPGGVMVTAEDLIAGYRQLITRAQARGVKVIGATILPFEGEVAYGYHSPGHDAIQQRVNDWIRTSGAYDGVMDFDRTMSDPKHLGRLLPAFDNGDHVHPNFAGHLAMAASVDLALFD